MFQRHSVPFPWEEHVEQRFQLEALMSELWKLVIVSEVVWHKGAVLCVPLESASFEQDGSRHSVSRAWKYSLTSCLGRDRRQ